MSYARLAMRLYNAPLVITPEKLDIIVRVFRAHEEGTAKLLAPYAAEQRQRPEVAANGQSQLTQSGYVRTSDGIAWISAVGTLVQRSGGMDAESGLASYASIGAMIDAAIADSQVRGILLEVDSSGGEVSGAFDLARDIRAASKIKPIYAHANELALSGGYVLAASAESIFTPATGLIGSIGVRMLHVDQSQYDAKRGFVYTDIIAGAHKSDMTPHAPLSDADRRWAQEHVDHSYEIFVDHVATSRSLDPQAVRDTEAQIYHADGALDLGLIDGIGTIGETLQLLRERVSSAHGHTRHGMRSAAAADDRTFQSSADADLTGVHEMPNDPVKQFTQADLEAARAAGKTEGEQSTRAAVQAEAEGKTKAQVEEAATKAAAEAQARVAGILGHGEAQGRDALAKHLAFKTTSSVDDAVAMLATAPKAMAEKVNPLAAAMGKIDNPKVGTGAVEGGGEEPTADALATRILNAGKRQALKAVDIATK